MGGARNKSELKMFLTNMFNDKNILKNAGRISNAQMKEEVKTIYEQFDKHRKIANAQQADKDDLVELNELMKKLKKDK